MFLEAAIVLSAKGQSTQAYLRERDVGLACCLILRAEDFEEARAMGKAFPILGIGGTVVSRGSTQPSEEIRELQKFNCDKIF